MKPVNTNKASKRSEDRGGEPLTCEVCGKTDSTVTTLFCGYDEDINGTQVEETICADCEHEHLMDI